MLLCKFLIKGYRSFKNETAVLLGDLNTIVGKNDVGKSNILYALDIFLNDKSVEENDFNKDLSMEDSIIMQASFGELPQTIQIEDGIDTDLFSENLVDTEGFFTVSKVYSRKNLKKHKTTFLIKDFLDDNYMNLCSLKEQSLNERGSLLGLDLKKSGSGITNKSKRTAIRKAAEENKINKGPVEIEPAENALKILNYIPALSLFKADESLNEEGTAFQKEFKAVVETAVDSIQGKGEIEKGVSDEINKEITKIHTFLARHTNDVASIVAKPSFKWKDLVSFYLECTDKQGKEIPLSNRGAGLRRLLMVAYFQYLAQKKKSPESLKSNIYAIEEPETYLHPGAQRDLLESLKLISASDQIVISSHSPVFAGSTDVDNLILVLRDSGVAAIQQRESLELEKVAAELGVESSDQIYGYKAIVFLEGPDDCNFFKYIGDTFYNSKLLKHSFEMKQIGLLPGGGDNLKHWVSRKAIKKLNHKYAVIIDSDRKSDTDGISAKNLSFKQDVESDGGLCFILKKREIENYLHKDVMPASFKNVKIDDFCDMKSLCGDKICGLISNMTVNQILERDKYFENSNGKHELLEICEELINLA